MGALRRHRGRHWVALVAAYLLFAQALFGALATGANAGPAQLGPTELILCASQGSDRLPGDPAPAGQHHLPDCCLPGCSMFAPAVMAAPDMAGVLRLAYEPAAVIFVVDEAARIGTGRDRSPANPRAPPVRA